MKPRRALYARHAGPVAAACLVLALPALAQVGIDPADTPQSEPVAPILDEGETRLLAAHNRIRAAAGVGPVAWDPQLAADARSYLPQLAALGRLVHSARRQRRGQGENLWRGTAGAFTPETVLDTWAEGQARFRPGIFPNVATTGDWLDVAHYTQVIWPGTTRIGCALRRAPQWDYIVCRYAPAGNIDGQQVP